jgi:hypothetical protein
MDEVISAKAMEENSRYLRTPGALNAGRIALLIPAVVGMLLPTPVQAQPADACEGRPSLETGGLPLTDTLRALVVFARFADDAHADSREWPLHRTTPPDFASELFAPSPDPATFPDASLTRYFHQQSGGRFTIFGEVYPRIVVPAQPEAHYRGQGWGYLTRDVLDVLDADPIFDFSKFDHNGDGFIDYVFLVIRRDADKTYSWAGVSDLRGSKPRRGNPAECLTYDGKQLEWETSGSIIIHHTSGNVVPLVYYRGLLAHELGHDIWGRHFVHLPVISSYRNDVPGVPRPSHQGEIPERLHSRRAAYALMAGVGGTDHMSGGVVISAHERTLMGWIECDELTGDANGLRIGDLATTGSCYQLEMPFLHRIRTLRLSNLQRVAPYAQLVPYCSGGFEPDGSCPRFYAEVGQMATGLLPTLSDGGHYLELPADNTLDKGVLAEVYEGDLYDEHNGRQLTPWTVPNISGYAGYANLPRNQQVAWMAVDDIRYTGAPGGEMAFDFVRDFRTRPTIRKDSWMGAETSGSTLTGPLIVRDRSTLDIDLGPGGLLVLAAGGRIKSGSRVIAGGAGQTLVLRTPIIVEPGATLEIRPGTRVLPRQPQALLRTPGRNPFIETGNSGIEWADSTAGIPDRMALHQNYPNPFNPSTTIRFSLPEATSVRLVVHDLTGRAIRTLVEQHHAAGEHLAVWDGRDASGRPAAGGVYLYRIETVGFSQVRSMMLIK